MTIRIIDKTTELLLTREEHDRLQRAHRIAMSYTTEPVDFETWARHVKDATHVNDCPHWLGKPCTCRSTLQTCARSE